MEHLKKAVFGIFCCLLLALPAGVLLFLHQPSSALEAENLAPLPTITVESVVDGSYFSGLSAHLTDHLPFREFWLRLQTRVTLALQKKEINDVHVLSDRLIRHLDRPREGIITASLASVRNFAETFDGKTFVMLVPTAEEICASLLPPTRTVSQQDVIQSAYSSLAENGITGVDALSQLAAFSDRYLFCRTDSRWTTFGAYCGYSAIARTMGITPAPLEKMNIEHVSHNYRGGLYWETGVVDVPADTIDIYTYSGHTPKTRLNLYDASGRQFSDSLYFREYLSTDDGYKVFLGEDRPLAIVETDYTAGESLLVFGDDLCDNLLPFLALHYSRIALVDLSDTSFNYKDYLNPNDYDSVLFCYGVDSLLRGGVIGRVNLPSSAEELVNYE